MTTSSRAQDSRIRIGAYELQLESHGIRLTRHRPRGERSASPLLVFLVDEPAGTQNQPVALHRLVMGSAQDQALFHGYSRQQISVDGEIGISPDGEGLHVAIAILNTSEPLTGRLVARLELPTDGEPWWLLPGVFYGDNRPTESSLPRPAYSEVQRDAKQFLYPQWSFRADRAALPLVSVWNHACYAAIRTGITFGEKLQSGYDPSHICGLAFGQSDNGPYIATSFPYRETPVRYAFSSEGAEAPSGEYFQLEENEPLRLDLDLRFASPARDAHTKALRLAYEAVRTSDAKAGREAHSRAARHAAEGILQWHYDRSHGTLLETVPMEWSGQAPAEASLRCQMHTGWLSGALPAYVLLWSGREREAEEYVQAGTTVINRITRQTAPCGTIFPLWSLEHGWSCSFGAGADAAHSRTIAEAIFFILRALALESHFGEGHPHWLEAALSSLNYAIGVQRDDGCLPAYFDLTTGAAMAWEGTGGLPWVAALASAASMLQREHYGDVAVRAGEYYAPFVRNGVLFGTLEDQPGVPAGQDAVWAVMAYINLYDWDRDIRWLRLACDAAEWMFTWQMAASVPMHGSTMLAACGLDLQGGFVESVSAPYLAANVLFCYRELCRLADYTGDPYYIARLDDAVRFAVQLAASVDGQFNGRRGMVPAQLYHVDWVRPRGTLLNQSSVMAAALIGYSDLVERSLRLPEQTRSWTELTRTELADRDAARYAEEEIQRLAGQRLDTRGAAEELAGVSALLELARGDTPMPTKLPEPSPEEARTPIPTAGGLNRPRRRPQPPSAPPFRDASQMTPVPYQGGEGPAEPPGKQKGERGKPGEGDGQEEIKYKIF